jgi:hypothetical protein
MEWEINKPDQAIEKYVEGFGYATPAAIKLGREREDWLIARYEIMRQKEWGKRPRIDRPGFIRHPSIKEFGSSPDWLELYGPRKSRRKSEPVQLRTGEGKTRTDQSKHEYAMQRGLLPEDKDQVYTHMMCAGAMLCDYVSYCPEYPDVAARIVIIEVELDKIYSNFLYAELNRFLTHLRAGTRPTVPQGHSGVPSFFD